MAHIDEPVTVVDNRAEQRFEATVDGQLAVAEYRRDREVIIFTHTEVPEPLEGRGIANALAHAGLEAARAERLSVVPRCRFFAAYIRRHPEYQPLVRHHY